MMFRLLALTLLLALPLVTLSAQIDDSETLPGETVGSDFYNSTYGAIGIHLSMLSGTGLSGRVTFPNRLAVQTSTFVIAIGGITHFNIGGELQYAFTQGDGGRLFALAGVGFYSSTSDEPEKPGNQFTLSMMGKPSAEKPGGPTDALAQGLLFQASYGVHR